MPQKLKIAALICTTSCLFNLSCTSLIMPVQASDEVAFLTEVSENLADLTEVSGLNDLNEDMSTLSERVADLPMSPIEPEISTAVAKVWAGTMWVKTWMWSQIRK